nr:MAG TPA: hypothetical protein [Caudoviricetes sp.]
MSASRSLLSSSLRAATHNAIINVQTNPPIIKLITPTATIVSPP